MPSLLSGSNSWLGLGLGLGALGALGDLADHVHFIRRMVSRLVPDGEGSLHWCHARPQPATRLCVGHWVPHIRSKSTHENGTARS